MTMEQKTIRCDLFCRVIDNFGDAGIAWRLALALTRQTRWRVRLIIDDLGTLAQLVPQIDTAQRVQCVGGVQLLVWDTAFESDVAPAAADVVIEAFSCFLPASYEQAVARRVTGRAAAVFALDYLTAEPYAESYHGLNSPHPRYGYPKTFFFPGFTRKTGGLIYEQDLPERLRALRAGGSREQILRALGLSVSAPLTVFVFTYPCVDMAALAAAMAHDRRALQLIVAPGQAGDALMQALERLGSPSHIRAVRSPMVPQDQFDALLSACDAVLVRGEDSVMRAQLTGTALLWTLYPQSEQTHLVKMKAFEALYDKNLSAPEKTARERLELGLNCGSIGLEDWSAWRDHLAGFQKQAENWQEFLFSETSLIERISQMAQDKLK